jgi:hypothetical protein
MSIAPVSGVGSGTQPAVAPKATDTGEAPGKVDHDGDAEDTAQAVASTPSPKGLFDAKA